MKFAAAAVVGAALLAQAGTTEAPVLPTSGYYDANGMWIPPSRDRAPDTDHCPHSLVPPEPVSTSERRPDGSTPTPLPLVYSGPCGITAADGFVVDPGVVASAWVVADIDSGEVIAMKDPHGRYRPASIIKVLIAMVAIDELDLDAVVPVSEESAGQEGSAAGIGAEGTYTVRDLLHGLILNSGNDTAHALAQALGGDQVTLAKVNRLAQELGMADTRATSYSGLDAAGMSTSAWDMALAYKAAFENPTFAAIAATEYYDFPGFGDLPGFQLWNDNKLFMFDPDGIGGKTGYTDDANHTFVGAVQHDGRRLMAVILDTAAWNLAPWQQAQALLHASYPLTPGTRVTTLQAATAPTTAAPSAPTTTTAAPTTSPGTPDGVAERADAAERELWIAGAVVAGVLVLAGLAMWLSRRFSRRS
ncbi:serine hydrolase [Corynebacterium sp. TA-R-1]|uniref:Serine hydrolase n=1 Tax=Corynebacterium stercoris TaxID=2943490 RepID=A0ABT1G2M8_9CORY|nr:serine hydrolase [Corynebacterium stercoris]MCP1388283.1 serine hydrolase [Corynebacterium stercoris]